MPSFETADSIDWAPLIDAATKARANAYAPYSRYSVGAAVTFDDGAIVAGCNVENASYGATICAERTAITYAVATGRRSPIACVVITRGPEPAAPCGVCRQVLSEFASSRAMPILLIAEESSARKLVRLNELLPMSFGPRDLD